MNSFMGKLFFSLLKSFVKLLINRRTDLIDPPRSSRSETYEIIMMNLRLWMILLSSTLLTAVASLLFLFILNALTLLIYYFDTFSCPPTFRMSQDLIVVSQTSEQVYVKLTITSSGKSSQCTSHDDKKLIFVFIYSKPVTLCVRIYLKK